MELGDDFRRGRPYVVNPYPGELFGGSLITQPLDVVAEGLSVSAIELGVNNGLDFIVDVVVDFDRRWWRFRALGEWIWEMGFELGDVEHGMNSTHGVRESESPGLGTDLADDFVRA